MYSQEENHLRIRCENKYSPGIWRKLWKYTKKMGLRQHEVVDLMVRKKYMSEDAAKRWYNKIKNCK